MRADVPAARTRVPPCEPDELGRVSVITSGLQVAGYQPHSTRGQMLLAHELTHTLQQRAYGGDASLRRKKGSSKRRNVIITTSSDLESKEPALMPGATVYRVQSLDELKAQLRAIDFPIDTILFNSHGSNGSLKVGQAWTDASVLGSELAGLLSSEFAPKLIDLRACNLGQNPGGMNAIREALGASKVLGGTCFLVEIPLPPMAFEEYDESGSYIGTTEITSKEQLKGQENKKYFDENFQGHLDSIQGPPGQTLPCLLHSDGTLEGAKKAYFKGKGHLIMAYFTPDITGAWDPQRSTCFGTAPTQKFTAPLGGQIFNFNASPCQLITVEAGKKAKK